MKLTADHVKTKARELGFDACGIAPAADHPELAFLPEWIARGYAGTMAYLARSARRRADVRNVLPSARVVISTATVYNTERPYSLACKDDQRAQIARYAWGDDYHAVLLDRLDALVAWMHEASEEPFDARAYVDTGPVQERVYAQHAGLGWIGKNTCLIHPELGSWVFLSEILCSLPLDTDLPSFDQCGDCMLCLEACPTHAIVDAGVLDATKCISYLTIEYRGQIPAAMAPGIGSHVYGCDVCQEVCPWNAVAPVSSDPAWQPRRVWDAPSIQQLAALSDAELEQALAGSAMERAKPAGIRRNVSVASSNRESS